MTRTPRRQPTHEPPVITPAMAYEWETTLTWPRGERTRFWSHPRVPEHLRQDAEPDPRPALISDSRRDEYHRALAKWNQQRLDWLRGQIHG